MTAPSPFYVAFVVARLNTSATTFCWFCCVRWDFLQLPQLCARGVHSCNANNKNFNALLLVRVRAALFVSSSSADLIVPSLPIDLHCSVSWLLCAAVPRLLPFTQPLNRRGRCSVAVRCDTA